MPGRLTYGCFGVISELHFLSHRFEEGSSDLQGHINNRENLVYLKIQKYYFLFKKVLVKGFLL
jgi:hypothetical protein